MTDEQTESVRNLNALLDVSRAMGAATSLDELLRVILHKASVVMEAERSSLFLYDETTSSLWSRVAEDLEEGQEIRFPIGAGVAGDVARSRRVANIPDAYADPRFNATFDRRTGFRTRAILCMPMLGHEGKLLGVIQVLNKQNGSIFTADDERLLDAFVSHAAIAIERARLVEAELEKQRIEEALALARRIQESMLPKRVEGGGARRDFEISARIQPAKHVGGDLYDYFLVGEDRLWITIGDVSGKGVGPALFMAITQTLLRAIGRTEPSPARVLERVNRELSQSNEMGMFATVFTGSLDLGTGRLRFASAGHNPPYRVTPDGTVTMLPRVKGLALGVIEDAKFAEAELDLAPGDLLYLYTDGVTDATAPDEETFGTKRLEEFLGRTAGAAAAEVVERTLATVAAFSGEAPQFDDITVLAVRR